MYKSPLDNFNDFYNQVFEKETASKQNNSKVEKSYFEYKNNQVYLRIKHDAINHGDKKHRLSAEEWKNVLENILNIENAAISNKQYSNDNVALIKVATPNGKYGVSIQFANGTNQISTIFKSTDKGIDSWIKKGSANSSTSEPLTSRDNSHTVAVVGQNPNDIIAYIKEQLNPSEQTKILYQSAATAGAETSAEISDAQKEWKEKGTDSKYFKKWFGDSKVVDENGEPLVVYHGTNADFEEFNPETFTSANGRSVLGNGFYFTQYRNNANEYGTNVLPVYLSIKNPYVVYNSTTGEESKPMQFLERIAEIMYGENYKDYLLENDGYYATGYLEGKLDTNSGFIDLMQGLQYKGKLDTREFLQSFGYDGIQDGDVFVAFTPEQIKSVNNQGTFDANDPNIYYQNAGTNYQEQVQDVKNNLEYKKFVNKVLSGKLSQKEKRQVFKIGRTPAKLVEAGLPDNEVCIGYKIIEKAQNNKNPDHNLSRETISKVWEALKNPIAVIKAEQNENEKQENNRYSAILDLQDDNGKYVLVAIKADKNFGKGVILNDIRSIHSRKSYEPIIDKALNDKRLLKVDAEKIRNLLWGSSDIISEGDQASSEKDLLTSQQSDLISDGAASLINSISQKYDKTRYKSINKMFATLKNPTFVNVSKNSGMYYFKIFKTNGGTKNQTVVVRTNELGEVVETTYPTKRDNNYFEKLKIGKTVYDVKNQRRKGDNNTAPVNNSIANNSTNNKPKRTGYVFQEPAQPNLFVENAAQNHNKGFVGIDLKGNRGLTDINRNYNDILSKGLQSTDLVFKTDNKNEYYNFIHFDNATNEQILVELSENKDNYEIVNFYKFSDKSLERKIKKANNEGGQILITDSNAKGAAVLSALGVSPNNIITINSTNNKSKRTGYVFQEPAQPNLFVENASQNHNKGFVGIDLKGNRGLTDINRNLILIGTNPLNTKDKKITCLMS